MTRPETVLLGHYDLGLVALSIAVAVLAAGAALDLAERVRQEHGRVWLLWLAGGAVAMGTGIWAMHFVGMAAFQLPVPVAYDLLHVGLSLLAAILASGIALFVVGRLMMTLAVVLLGGVLMGAGIVAMHYIGMAAMRLSATIHYSVPWVTLSVALAIGISSLALWLTFQVRDFRWVVNWRKAVSAVVMGLAIPTMHYSGMAAASFNPANILVDLSRSVTSSSLSIGGIVTATVLLLGIASLTSQIDRRLAEQGRALQASEARYRHLVEYASDILYRTDASGIVTYCNPIATRITQYSQQELVDRHFLELVHPDYRQAAKRFYDVQYVRQTPNTYYEFPTVTKEGQTIWIGQNVQLVKDGDQIVGFQAVARDITERKRAEELRTRLAAIVESSDDAIIGETLEGIIQSWNKGAERIYGYQAAEVVGRPIAILVPPDRPDEVPAMLEKIGRGERVEHFETVRVRKDGTRVDVSLTLSPVSDGTGRIIGASVIARDITQRKQNEEELHQLYSLKDDLVSLIVHDLRNPLFGVKGHLQLLELDTRDQAQSSVHDSVHQALTAAAKLQELIDDILQVRLLEEGHLALTQAPIPARKLVEEAIATLDGDAKARRVNVNCEVIGDPVLKIDAKLVRRSIENLLANALKYSPEQGIVSVTVQPEAGGARIEVADQGQGIPDKWKETLFEKFGSVEVKQGGMRKGHGLGLYLVKQVMLSHGGSVSVHDRAGGGTVFRLFFPDASP
jgi:PAS domain S-box-containing protein